MLAFVGDAEKFKKFVKGIVMIGVANEVNKTKKKTRLPQQRKLKRTN